jgi:hypothetical protein
MARGDHSKAITGIRHVQVRDENVEALRSDTSQSFGHASGNDYIKSLAFKRHIHHGANGIIVIHKEHSMGNRLFGRSHKALPLVTSSDSVTQVYFRRCIKVNSS